MDIADRDNGGCGGMQHPDKNRKEHGDVADLGSSTDSVGRLAMALAAARAGIPSIARESRPAGRRTDCFT